MFAHFLTIAVMTTDSWTWLGSAWCEEERGEQLRGIPNKPSAAEFQFRSIPLNHRPAVSMNSGSDTNA